MCAWLGASTRSFLGELGQEAGLVQTCSDIWMWPLWGLYIVPVMSLQGNEGLSGSKTQSVGVLRLMME